MTFFVLAAKIAGVIGVGVVLLAAAWLAVDMIRRERAALRFADQRESVLEEQYR